MNKSIIWHHHSINKKSRSKLNGHSPCIIWFTGLSGSGKSTIAGSLEYRLFELGSHTYLLDGDNVRHGLNKDLSFTNEDRIENIRRIGETAKLFVDAGLIVCTAFISPFRADRAMVRGLVDDGEFIEVFLNTPLETCEQRDPKGLYKKARKGEIKHFTGIDSAYEASESPEITVNTHEQSIEQCVQQIISYLQTTQIIKF